MKTVKTVAKLHGKLKRNCVELGDYATARSAIMRVRNIALKGNDLVVNVPPVVKSFTVRVTEDSKTVNTNAGFLSSVCVTTIEAELQDGTTVCTQMKHLVGFCNHMLTLNFILEDFYLNGVKLKDSAEKDSNPLLVPLVTLIIATQNDLMKLSIDNINKGSKQFEMTGVDSEVEMNTKAV